MDLGTFSQKRGREETSATSGISRQTVRMELFTGVYWLTMF